MKQMGPPTITQTGIQIVTSGTSATGTIAPLQNGTIPRYVRVVASVAACVRMFPAAGGNAVVADTQIQPGDSLIMCVPDGYTKISAIQVSAPGVVQVSSLENS